MNAKEKDTPAVVIEMATVADAAAIFDLQQNAYQTEAAIYNDPTIPPLLETRDQLREQFRSKRFWKAVVDARIVGSVRTFEKAGTCYINRLMVYPEYRRCGIGTSLLRKMEEEHPKAARFELFTGDKSAQNLQLYTRLGYQLLHRETVNANLTMVFLEKINSAE
jgi:ribosomal protein S18 acetylase RimI-like enzyme